MTLAELRDEIFKLKAKNRGARSQVSLEEKFRVLEEMRDFTSMLGDVRAENRARVKAAWVEKPSAS
jgi:hypothetical protein